MVKATKWAVAEAVDAIIPDKEHEKIKFKDAIQSTEKWLQDHKDLVGSALRKYRKEALAKGELADYHKVTWLLGEKNFKVAKCADAIGVSRNAIYSLQKGLTYEGTNENLPKNVMRLTKANFALVCKLTTYAYQFVTLEEKLKKEKKNPAYNKEYQYRRGADAYLFYGHIRPEHIDEFLELIDRQIEVKQHET